ncbi:MAG: hypothetical protein E6J45_03805 [Chloroflexi bacterium]|nr:MAG: hypothetical protein E6J45_03805 [Chloroflexota bacterium]
MNAQQVHVEERVAGGTVLVRFRDDEILEGSAPDLDLDRPDFSLTVADAGTNNRGALVPLASVKSVLLERRAFDSAPDATRLQKLAIHFWDGEVLKGLLSGEPERHAHGVIVSLVGLGLDEQERYAIPFAAIKAAYYLKTWDSRGAEYVRETGRWTLGRADTPLLDLLGEIHGLNQLRTKGHLTAVEFEKRRREVLERI